MRLHPILLPDLVDGLWLRIIPLHRTFKGHSQSRKHQSKENGSNNNIQGRGKVALPSSHEVRNGPPCFLSSFSEKSLGAAGSDPSPRLGRRFMAKDYSALAAL